MRNYQEQQKPQNLSSIEFNCNVLPKSFLNGKQVKVIIQNPKPIEMGFFSSNYIVYEIKTNILPDKVNWLVNRRYSDFINLRTALQNLFPNNLVPPLPGKKMGGRRFEIDFVSKRMKKFYKPIHPFCNIFVGHLF